MKIEIKDENEIIFKADLLKEQADKILSFVKSVHAIGFIDTWIDAACAYFGVSKEAIGKSQTTEACNARAVVFWHIYTEMGVSSSQCGRIFKKDHATVLHSLKVAAPRVKHAYIAIRQQLEGQPEAQPLEPQQNNL